MAETMPAVILAGGLATRLRPITEKIPKALVEIAGHPFLYHQVVLLREHGIRRLVLCVGYLGEMIEEAFGDGSNLGVSISYSFDGPTLLGTAGAIRRALPLLPDEFFVLYGDSYLRCDYAAIGEVFRRSGRKALMTVFHNEGLYDTSNVEFDGHQIVAYDKRNRNARMRHIDYGLGAFKRGVFEELPEHRVLDMAEVYQQLLGRGELAGYEVFDRFYEIGSPEGLRETAELLSDARLPFSPE